MYTAEEFDEKKTKVFKYIMFKKRTENEIRNKFRNQIEENMLDDIIQYLKEAGYINDYSFIEKQVNEYINLKNMSIQEIKYKLLSKGINKDLIVQVSNFVGDTLDIVKELGFNKILLVGDLGKLRPNWRIYWK